ncbi:MAG: hypothetical protein IT162_18015 [Bryobacterales bacterium]|nr:hypothetical protein [Bryobacterales bacterium]
MRRLWIAAGLGFTAWMVMGFQAVGVAPELWQSSARVKVAHAGFSASFFPQAAAARRGLIFLPGGLVDPEAYVPLARAVAEAGHPVLLHYLPMRSAFTEKQIQELFEQVQLFLAAGSPNPWVIAGHSRGAMLAARFVHERPHAPHVAGLALLGTTHPRDFSLASVTIPVTKIYGTHDGIAPLAAMQANRDKLPPHTRWMEIKGGNHTQFGFYRHQLFDGTATIPREEQMRQVVQALLQILAD